MKDHTKEQEKRQEFDHVSYLLTKRAREEFEAMIMLDHQGPPHHHDETEVITLTTNDRPPSLVTVSVRSSTRSCWSEDEETMVISYDDDVPGSSTRTISSSISFFLSVNKLPAYEDTTEVTNSYTNSYEELPTIFVVGDANATTLNNVGQSKRKSIDLLSVYSRSSSKLTTDSSRIVELREKKRIIEKNLDKKYNRFQMASS